MPRSAQLPLADVVPAASGDVVFAPGSSRYPPADRRTDNLQITGLPVAPVGSPEILEYMAKVIAQSEQSIILHLNVHGANLAARHAWLRDYFHQAQLVFCDGDGIRLGLRILGQSPPPKVTYNEWLWQVASFCAERGISLYLLGSRPGIAEQARRNLIQRHPSLRIVGTHDGYFQKQGPESEAVIAGINRLRPDVLLVCFGMPLQEQWVKENSHRLATNVILTGGAALDYAAGTIRMTPGWMKKLHLEWLFRFLAEPLRMFRRYILGNPQFLLRVLVERVTGKKAADQANLPNP